MDTKNYQHINHPKVREILLQNREAFDLKDPFRELYPTLRRYTRRKSSPLKLARLDFFLL